MKRKTMALMLALSMCLSLLSACGSGDKATDDKPPESENAVSSTEQQPEESEKPEESEEPKEEEPEESKGEEPEESAEPTQEEPKEEHAGTKLLALLQEEYQNGFFEGEGPRHTYFNLLGDKYGAAIYNGVVYIREGSYDYCAYDIASKELRKSVSPDIKGNIGSIYFVDGDFYYINWDFDGNNREARMFDCNGTLLGSIQQEKLYSNLIVFEAGFLSSGVLLPYDLKKIVDIPAPQREIEHGLKEDVKLNSMFAADGTVYARANEQLYRLNTATYEWEEAGEAPSLGVPNPFFGKYVTRGDGIYDCLTGELVFEYGELYPAANDEDRLCYFGGDKYLGKKGNEYRWVNLTDLTMSDPLPFPENASILNVLNDTYCVYSDQYGYFLWNYNTGEEENIMMFEQ